MAENVKITISALDKTKKGFGSATKGLKAVAGAVLNAKTAIVGLVGAAGFGALIASSLRATDTLTKTANKIGTTTEALGALRYAADLTGVSTQTMDMALQRFTRRTAEAAKGMGEAKGAIKELGINAQELNRMPLDKRMIVLADAFAEVESESDRLRLAFKLFDSEGAALVNTLSQGGDGLRAMLGEARALGLTMSSTAAKGVEDTVDSLTKLQSLFKGVTDQTVAAFAPAIEAMVVRFTAFLQRTIEAKGGVELFARSLAKTLISGIQNALIGFEKLANGFISIYNEAIRTKNNLKNLFSIGAKDVRQYNEEIAKLETRIAKVGENTAGLSPANQETAIKNFQERINALIKLRDEAQDTESAELLGNISTKYIRDELEGVKSALDIIGDSIPKAAVPALDSINNVDLGFKAWQQTVKDGGEIVQSFTTNALDGMTDALTAGITGAANFADAMKSMAKSVVDSLIKMLVQKYIVDAAFGAITGYFGSGGDGSTGSGATSGGGSGIPQFDPRGYAAIGGPVESGSPYIVGERGPEMFVPNQKGAIIPNNKLGGGGGVVVNQTINVSTGVQQTVRAEIATLMPQIANAAKGAVADARMRGGGYSKALVGA
jgi:hypothetical protein